MNINDMSEQDQIKMIKKHSIQIAYIDNPTEAVQLAAVNKHGSMLAYIKNPSEAVQLAAIKNWPPGLKEIKNPSKHMIITSILYGIKIGYSLMVREVLERYKNENWPELDIIRKSFEDEDEL